MRRHTLVSKALNARIVFIEHERDDGFVEMFIDGFANRWTVDRVVKAWISASGVMKHEYLISALNPPSFRQCDPAKMSSLDLGRPIMLCKGAARVLWEHLYGGDGRWVHEELLDKTATTITQVGGILETNLNVIATSSYTKIIYSVANLPLDIKNING